ncbi:MAG: hypothetical protein J7604_17290 [Sporocytophaga sp.]|uniref:hypothetical protein n=1 Tax=Sporocytophaga sp. TaxID=2231183 RepID=UPI001B0AF904|nr:hypothetical protein [Sporocytophaga sp.]MBO9701965.1 hypothetical protein [Sporocytophaga sp.]
MKEITGERRRCKMGVLDTVKNVGESVTSKGSEVEAAVDVNLDNKDLLPKEGKLAEQTTGALTNALAPVAEMGTEAAASAIVAFLKTDEGKKVVMPIAKHYLKKYWWAVAGIAAFEVIGIFATIRFSLLRR